MEDSSLLAPALERDVDGLRLGDDALERLLHLLLEEPVGGCGKELGYLCREQLGLRPISIRRIDRDLAIQDGEHHAPDPVAQGVAERGQQRGGETQHTAA